MSKTDRNKLPTKEKIAEYWADKVQEFGVFDANQNELHANECWACGNGMRVQRCHITAYLDGGPNEASNLVLLCANFHIESETLPPATFWPWVRNMRKTRWKAPVLHSLQRMESYGYSLQDVLKDAAGGDIDQVKRKIGTALGVIKKDELQ